MRVILGVPRKVVRNLELFYYFLLYKIMAAATTMGYSAFSDKDLQENMTQDTESRNDLKLFKQNILQEDAIQLSLEMMQSQGPGYYHMDSQYATECGLKEARDVQVSQPGINFKG